MEWLGFSFINPFFDKLVTGYREGMLAWHGSLSSFLAGKLEKLILEGSVDVKEVL